MGKLIKITINKEIKPLYDIEVKDNHNFIANGIVVKNSEQYLGRENLCILSSINCAKFSSEQEIYEKEIEKISYSINRFLDNVNECELKNGTYATPHQRLGIEKLRRTGAGITNIAGWLFKNNVEYGSKKSSQLMEKFMERYAYYLYRSSIDLGKEKGSFGLFDKNKIEKAPFIKRMKSLGLDFTALRNVTLVSVAPSGSLSLMFRDAVMSYGIEPAFGMYYWKRTRMKGDYVYYFIVPSVVREAFKQAGCEIPMESDIIEDSWDGEKGKKIVEFIEANKEKAKINFKEASSITCKEKLDLMANVMKWVDSSISVTYMLSEDATWKDVYEFILLAHEKELKSITVFPDKKMYGIMTTTPFKELAKKLISEGVNIHNQNFSDIELKELNISKNEIKLNTTNAPKREKTLKAEIYKITVDKQNFIIAIGLQNGYPYEIFGGKLNGLSLNIPHKHLTGEIVKISSGKYSLQLNDICIEDFSQHFNPVEKQMFRSLSLMMRHGIPIQYIVEQLSKANDDMFSLSAAVVRVLKKYIKDGQKVSGRKCPNCQGMLIYMDGCVSCPACQYSRCE